MTPGPIPSALERHTGIYCTNHCVPLYYLGELSAPQYFQLLGRTECILHTGMPENHFGIGIFDVRTMCPYRSVIEAIPNNITFLQFGNVNFLDCLTKIRFVHVQPLTHATNSGNRFPKVQGDSLVFVSDGFCSFRLDFGKSLSANGNPTHFSTSLHSRNAHHTYPPGNPHSLGSY